MAARKKETVEKVSGGSLESALAGIDKDYGAGSVLRMGNRVGVQIDTIPTGLWDVDNRITNGGIPRGRLTEIFGNEASGKTTLTLTVIANAQQAGLLCAFIDAEHALDPSWAALNRVDVDNLYVCQPDTGEQGLDISQRLIDTGKFGLVVVDSVAALVPRAELEGDIGDSHMGLHARLMSQACRKLVGDVRKTNTALVFINQNRAQMGGMSVGNTTTGGKALKFYSSLRLEVSRTGNIVKGDDDPTGIKVKIVAKKNKLSSPYGESEVLLKFDRGFDSTASTVEVGIIAGLIQKSGSWYTYGELKTQGEDSFVDGLNADKDLYSALVSALKERIKK